MPFPDPSPGKGRRYPVCKANSLDLLSSSPKGLETWGNVLILAPSNPEAPGPRPSREVQEARANPSTVSASPMPVPLHLPVVMLQPGGAALPHSLLNRWQVQASLGRGLGRALKLRRVGTQAHL